MKKTVTWILTADHQSARVFANDGPDRGIHPVAEMTMAAHLPSSHEAGSHRPDLGFASKGGPGHGVDRRSNPHDKAAGHFIDRVAAALVEASDRGAFQRLVLAAPPRALGELRDRLPDRVRDRVVGEMDLDLTKASTEAVCDHAGRFLAV